MWSAEVKFVNQAVCTCEAEAQKLETQYVSLSKHSLRNNILCSMFKIFSKYIC